MKKALIIFAVVILVLLLAAGCFYIVKINSPEYALLRIINDTKESGLDGLKPHLTENALEKLNSVESISESSGLIGKLSSIISDSLGSFLKSRIDDIEWSLQDVLRGKKSSEAVIGFDFSDPLLGSFSGTIPIKLLKEDGEWKIDGFGLPTVSKTGK